MNRVFCHGKKKAAARYEYSTGQARGQARKGFDADKAKKTFKSGSLQVAEDID